MNDEVESSIEDCRRIARMGPLPDAHRLRQAVGSVAGGLMATRAAELAVYGESGIEKERLAEIDALFGDRRSRCRHVRGERLEHCLRLFQESRVVVGRNRWRNIEHQPEPDHPRTEL